MFNLIIVDDKKSIREGISKFVKWNELGYQVAGVFPSANEALKFIEEECVDVLLTDIVMPDVTGLDLIKELRSINPEIKVIILSAYEKFEYAQEAVRLGVFSYLTKPVNIDKLEVEFTKLRSVLESERLTRLQKKEIGVFAREQFLNNLVNNYYTSEFSLHKKSEELEIQIFDKNYCLLRIFPQDCQPDSNSLDENSFHLLKTMLSSHIEEYLNTLGTAYIFNSNLSDLSVLFFPTQIENIKSLIEVLQEDIVNNFNIHVFIGISSISNNIMNASRAYQEAGKALEYRIIRKSSPVLVYDELSEFFKGRSLITQEVEENLLDCISSCDERSLKKFLEDILQGAFLNSNNNTSILYDVSIELLLIVNKFLASNVDIKSREHNDYYSIKTLLQKENYEEIKSFMWAYLKHSFDLFQAHDEQSAGLIIENVKKYINEHYSEEITLNLLSEVVYVNPTYLSRLFKAKTGENFMDNLTKIRIDRAKELLSDLSLRIYDISELVGYKSRKHFGKIFKDMTNLTPKEYRNQITGFKEP